MTTRTAAKQPLVNFPAENATCLAQPYCSGWDSQGTEICRRVRHLPYMYERRRHLFDNGQNVDSRYRSTERDGDMHAVHSCCQEMAGGGCSDTPCDMNREKIDARKAAPAAAFENQR